MPIYEYVCSDCHACFEALRSMAKVDAPIVCQRCDGSNTARKVSAAFAHSRGRVTETHSPGQHSSSGCGSCAGGACSSCKH